MPKKSSSTAPTQKRPVTQGLRVGGRSERVVSAVLRAAAEVLARQGYAAFQIEEVARAADVNRTSIYRRWPTKAQLVEAALRDIAPFGQSLAPSGDLTADILAMLRQVLPWLRTDQARSLRRVVQHGEDLPELARIVKRLSDEFLLPWKALFADAIVRGEIARHHDTRLLAEMIIAPMVSRIEAGERVDRRVIGQIIAIVLAGARPTKVRGRTST